MYKKILAPLDGSELSECTLRHLKAVAKGCQTPEVVLLYIVEPYHKGEMHYRHIGLTEEELHQGEVKEEAYGKDYLAKVAEKMKKDGLKVKTDVIHGMPAEEIVNYAEKNGVDLIIMSTHGRSGVTRWALGSVAERVLRHSATPVLVAAPKSCRM
ncbi:MAG: universal stress protein [Dehalococcoidales bacterium]|nr:universal stress protein [Dehalococcoidales bacterium]